MVRETVATIAGDQATLNETLSGSAGRFERPATINDLQQIQAQLVREVATLKRITIERREAWEKTFKDFRRTTIWPLLAELMALDTQKHIRILEFLLQHAKETARAAT